MPDLTLLTRFERLEHTSLGRVVQSKHSVVLLSALATALIFSLVWRLIKRSPDWRNDEGKHLKELPGEIRFMKFFNHQELSKQGTALAGTEPYLVRSGPYRELVITQPSHVFEFYHKDAKGHGKPAGLNLGQLVGRIIGQAVGAQYGDTWRDIRKHFDPPFAFNTVIERTPKFVTEIDNWIGQVTPNKVSQLNSKEAFRFLVFRLLSIHLFEDAFDDRFFWRMLELYEIHEDAIKQVVMSRWPDNKLWNWLPIGGSRAVNKFNDDWALFAGMAVENAEKGRWKCPAADIHRGVQQNDMTEEAFFNTLSEIFFTNVEISGQMLSTIFGMLAANQSIQDELRAEIKEWKSKPDYTVTAYLSKSETLLNRVLMESMRLSPAFWFSMPETTAEAKKIGGYHIPARTTVIIDNRRLNNEAVTWGSNGHEFDPDRFLRIPQQNLRCGFMRYGTGANQGRCLGRNVANLVFKLTTIAVIEKFKLDSVGSGEKKDIVLSELVDVKMTRL